jgi:hypothetical protein
VEPVELSVPEVLETSSPIPPAAAAEDEAGTAAVAAGMAGSASAAAVGPGIEVECCCPTQQEPSSSSCPQSPGASLDVEGRVNQMVEVVEAMVHEHVLKVIM